MHTGFFKLLHHKLNSTFVVTVKDLEKYLHTWSSVS